MSVPPPLQLPGNTPSACPQFFPIRSVSYQKYSRRLGVSRTSCYILNRSEARQMPCNSVYPHFQPCIRPAHFHIRFFMSVFVNCGLYGVWANSHLEYTPQNKPFLHTSVTRATKQRKHSMRGIQSFWHTADVGVRGCRKFLDKLLHYTRTTESISLSTVRNNEGSDKTDLRGGSLKRWASSTHWQRLWRRTLKKCNYYTFLKKS